MVRNGFRNHLQYDQVGSSSARASFFCAGQAAPDADPFGGGRPFLRSYGEGRDAGLFKSRPSFAWGLQKAWEMWKNVEGKGNIMGQ